MFQLSHPTPGNLAMAGSLTIYEVSQAHSELAAVLHSESQVDAWRLDLSAIEELDTAGVQLLLALHKSLLHLGIVLETFNPAAAVRELLELLRLNHLLPPPAAQA
jgi:anti-sigma B factor antagonist